MPASLTRCNCSICHRLGALWAYFDAAKVTVHSGNNPVDIYRWGKKSITYHRCGECGCTTHYTTTEADGSDLVAVNCRMAPAALIEAIPIRRFDGMKTWRYLDE